MAASPHALAAATQGEGAGMALGARPSIFEAMAQHYFVPSLQPAVTYVLQILAQRNPGRWFRLLQHGDEAFLLLQGALDTHYLRRYDATFAENFYGMKRMAMHVNPAVAPFTFTKPIRTHHRWSSILLSLLLPYAKAKLDARYKELQGGTFEDADHVQARALIGRNAVSRAVITTFAHSWPYVAAVYEGSHLAFHVAYLLDVTEYFSPMLWLQGIVLRTLTPKDVRDAERLTVMHRLRWLRWLQGPRKSWRPLWWLRWLASRLLAWLHGVADYAHWLLPAALFAFQFLAWWYDEEQRMAQPSLVVPPPPMALEPVSSSDGGLSVPEDESVCPLCLKQRTNDAALPSGYTFCYPCIHTHLERHARCPVTHVPARTTDIRKLYE